MKIIAEIEVDDQLAEDLRLRNAEDLGAALKHGLHFLCAMEFRKARGIRGRMNITERAAYEDCADRLIREMRVQVDGEEYANINLRRSVL